MARWLTCLSIGEDAGVVALEGVVQQVLADFVEDILLAAVVRVVVVQRIEAVVEREALRLLAAVKNGDRNSYYRWINQSKWNQKDEQSRLCANYCSPSIHVIDFIGLSCARTCLLRNCFVFERIERFEPAETGRRNVTRRLGEWSRFLSANMFVFLSVHRNGYRVTVTRVLLVLDQFFKMAFNRKLFSCFTNFLWISFVPYSIRVGESFPWSPSRNFIRLYHFLKKMGSFRSDSFLSS